MRVGRRGFLQGAGAVAAFGVAGIGRPAVAAANDPLLRAIPSTGEKLPVVGLGSWITFNVGNDPVLLDESADVVSTFFANGGRMIDSSPMYGSSQNTIGYALKKLGYPDNSFAADKIWTASPGEGPEQFAQTRSLWGVERMDLMQIHNLLSWREHLDMLNGLKAAGRIRYVGITTSHGRRHQELERIMTEHPLDFVQLTYNVMDREPEQRLLPLARERGIAVIVNRPYRRGELMSRFSGEALPPFAEDIGATSWAQLLLKFIIAHPAVTCAIPATTKTEHVKENLEAAAGPLPDAATRQKIIDYVDQL